MHKKAFTLVELIVVITILAILGTIAFISLSGYSKEARDSKRITDTSSLLSKINIEEVRGTNLSDLIITETDTETLKILGKDNPNVQSFRKANFKTLKEDEKNFEDPFKKGQHYPMAYAIGGSGKDAYKFVQIASVSEKENRNMIKGNYYKLDDDDAPSLFYSEEFYTEKPSSDLVYDLDGVVPKEDGGEEEKPRVTIEYPDTEYSENGQIWKNIIIKDGEGKEYVIMDRNLGAITNDISLCKENDCPISIAGNYYQWGRNKAFNMEHNVDTPRQDLPIDGTIGLKPKTDSYNFVWNKPLINHSWAIGDIDNNWGGKGDTDNEDGVGTTKEGRQGPCPNGYHVPSALEWNNIIKIWFEYRGKTEEFSIFQKDFKIPYAGHKTWYNNSIDNLGLAGGYWTSSPYLDSDPSDKRAYQFGFGLHNIQVGNNRYADGRYIKCFKN